jgi:hypothetical protein
MEDGLPSIPDGIAMCQKGDDSQPLSGKDGNRDEGYDDRRGSGKTCFPTPWRVDDGAREVSLEAVAGSIPQIHG